MIYTDKQLKVTQAKILEFEVALANLEKKKDQMPMEEYAFEESGINNLLNQLRIEEVEYKELSDEDCKSRVLNFSIDKLPEYLIKARLVRKMSQSELAKETGIEPQAIQRYEANGYAGVGYERLLRIKDALDIEIDCETQIMDKGIFNTDGYGEDEIMEKENKILSKGIFQI